MLLKVINSTTKSATYFIFQIDVNVIDFMKGNGDLDSLKANK
jgi:hypothetical protein